MPRPRFPLRGALLRRVRLHSYHRGDALQPRARILAQAPRPFCLNEALPFRPLDDVNIPPSPMGWAMGWRTVGAEATQGNGVSGASAPKQEFWNQKVKRQ